MWHTRGSWSAREDRTPSAVWLGILWVAMIAGFGVDIPHFTHLYHPVPRILYVHAAVFTTWLLLLTAQVLLVLGDRVAWHRKLGWFLAGWACLMAVLGPWAAMVAAAVNPHGPLGTPFLSVNLVDIVGFLVLLAWGITLRKNPAAHRRMMILSTVSLADPGFARFSGHFHLFSGLSHLHLPSAIPFFVTVFYGNVLLIVLMASWDWWRGRLMRSFAVGAVGLLAAEWVAALLYFWEPWKALTFGWVELWAKHFA